MVWFRADPNIIIRRLAAQFATSQGLLPGDTGTGGSSGVAGAKGANGVAGPAGATGATGVSGAAPLAVTITSPVPAAVLPINSAAVITGTVSSGDPVDVYLVYPQRPIGPATVVGTAWSISYTPDLSDHGSYTLTAVARRGAATEQATRAVSITAVPQPGTWAANNGAWYDFRLIDMAPGSDSPMVVPLEGSGNLTPTATPIVRIGAGNRAVLDFLTANAEYLTAPNTSANGIRHPFTLVVRGLMAVGSCRLVCLGNSGGATDFIEISANSGKVVQILGRVSGGTQVTRTFTSDLDLPTNGYHTLVLTSDGTSLSLYYDGVADASNPQTFDLSSTLAMTANQLRVAARAINAPNGFLTGQIQVVGVKGVAVDAAEALALHNAIIASDQPAPNGALVMPVGDSLTLGPMPNGGYRKELADYCQAQLLTIDLTGPLANGNFLDNQHCGFGGNDMASVISQQINVHMGTGKGFDATQLAVWIGGTNDVDLVGKTVDQLDTSFRAVLAAMHSALVTSTPTARIAVSKFPRYLASANAAAAALVADFNTNRYTAACDAFDALHPSNKLFRFSVFDATTDADMNADGRHILAAGYTKILNDATHGLLAASDGTGTVASYLAAIG